MITDSQYPFLSQIVIMWSPSRIMNDKRGRASLYNVYGNIICSTQGQYLWLAAPYRCVPYCYTILLKCCRGHKSCVGCSCAIFPFYGWEKRKKIVRMGIYIIGSCAAECYIACLVGGHYAEEGKLVAYG